MRRKDGKPRAPFRKDGRSKRVVEYSGKEKGRLTVVCLQCAKTFVAARQTRKYCSNWCRHQAGYVPVAPMLLTCTQCGTSFVKKKYDQAFCSPLCYSRYYTDKTRPEYNARMRQFHAKTRRALPWKPLVHGAKERARKKGLPFDLTDVWAISKWTGKCELTGMAFGCDHRHRAADSPSIDRVDPALGYVQTNCRFVIWAVNSLKAEGTDSDMYRVLNAILGR